MHELRGYGYAAEDQPHDDRGIQYEGIQYDDYLESQMYVYYVIQE